MKENPERRCEMTQKLCEHLFERGEWSEKICQANCNRERQLKCSFLEKRIIDEANNPDHERP